MPLIIQIKLTKEIVKFLLLFLGSLKNNQVYMHVYHEIYPFAKMKGSEKNYKYHNLYGLFYMLMQKIFTSSFPSL
jgi:hypothetical protein